MNNSRTIWLFMAAVVLIPVLLFATWQLIEKNFAALPVYDQEGREVFDFKMQNQEGRWVSPGEWKNKVVVVNFFFTHCPTICPKMTNNLKTVSAVYKDDPQVQINSFSVDPERDTVAALKKYAARYNVDAGNWNLVTGDKIEIYRLARKSFSITATDGDGGPNDFIHSDKLVLLDKAGQIRGYYDGTSETEVKQLINDIKKLEK